MKLSFWGAAHTVTGSKYLLESGNRKILIDCGMFQGIKDLRLLNWDDMPVSPDKIDAVLLTHAHFDHSGYIPKLVKDGFRGKIYCSEATRELAEIILKDSGHIQEEDAERANRYGYSKHAPALALYTEMDAERAMEQFETVPFAKKIEILNGEFSFSLHRAGHILGAASIRVEFDGGTSILFSGDLGRKNDPLMKPPVDIQQSDYIVVESTYGDRLHDKTDPADLLEEVINRTVQRGGSVIIPAFAVGRAQNILFYLHQLRKEGRIPSALPIYLDSPMAVSATELLCRHSTDHRLSSGMCQDVCSVAKYVRTKEESKALDSASNGVPKIIVSASGMATGGRVLHHLVHYIGDHRSTVILAGFQAAGTRGDRLARGEKTIKIHGAYWDVSAEIIKLDTMSAHADYAELMDWLRTQKKQPRKVFVTHGEAVAAMAMRDRIEDELGWVSYVPEYGYSEDI